MGGRRGGGGAETHVRPPGQKSGGPLPPLPPPSPQPPPPPPPPRPPYPVPAPLCATLTNIFEKQRDAQNTIKKQLLTWLNRKPIEKLKIRTCTPRQRAGSTAKFHASKMLAVKVGQVLNKTMLIGYLVATRVIMIYCRPKQQHKDSSLRKCHLPIRRFFDDSSTRSGSPCTRYFIHKTPLTFHG